MTTEIVLTDEQIGAILDSPGNIEYVIADKKQRLTLFARAIEQAVLQSPEIQRLREDAARYQHALNHDWPEFSQQISPTIEPPTWGYSDNVRFGSPAEAIDAAMQQESPK